MRIAPQITAMLAAVTLAAGAAQAQDAAAGLDTVRRATRVCAACHGEGGRSENPSIPSLAGQMRQYTIAQLRDFRSQIRAEPGLRGYMWGISALLDDPTINGLAEYFAEQTPAPAKPAKAKAVQEAGRRIFAEGIAQRGVRPCASCHGDRGEGTAGFPRLAGQHADYVNAQLKVFRTWLRPHGVVMRAEIKSMTPAEMRAVATYVQSL